MIRHRKPVLLGLTALLLLPSLLAQDKGKPAKMTEEGRALVLRTFQSEFPFAKRYFPMGKVGIKIDQAGKITPNEAEVRQMSADFGPAAKPGDRVKITNVYFKGSNIIFEINGGPVKRKKWYERVEVGSAGGMTTPADRNPNVDNSNARGSYVMLSFKDYIPAMQTQQIKDMLAPVLDFNAISAAEAYAKSLPPIVQEALKNHKALVGMDRDMVMAAKGRPPKKYRDRDGDTDYEEWIYGEPPKEVEFVRFVGDRVTKIETMKVDGEKEVRTAKEVDLDSLPGQQQKVAKNDDDQPQKGPSLLRPGEKPVAAQPGARIDPKNTPNPNGGPGGNTDPNIPDASQGSPMPGPPNAPGSPIPH